MGALHWAQVWGIAFSFVLVLVSAEVLPPVLPLQLKSFPHAVPVVCWNKNQQECLAFLKSRSSSPSWQPRGGATKAVKTITATQKELLK